VILNFSAELIFDYNRRRRFKYVPLKACLPVGRLAFRQAGGIDFLLFVSISLVVIALEERSLINIDYYEKTN
jgi:hypothetical protein